MLFVFKCLISFFVVLLSARRAPGHLVHGLRHHGDGDGEAY